MKDFKLLQPLLPRCFMLELLSDHARPSCWPTGPGEREGEGGGREGEMRHRERGGGEGRQTDGRTDGQTDRRTETETEIESQRETEKQTATDGQSERLAQTDRDWDRRILTTLDRLVGLLVKASSSRAKELGSILAFSLGIFPGRVIPVTSKLALH